MWKGWRGVGDSMAGGCGGSGGSGRGPSNTAWPVVNTKYIALASSTACRAERIRSLAWDMYQDFHQALYTQRRFWPSPTMFAPSRQWTARRFPMLLVPRRAACAGGRGVLRSVLGSEAALGLNGPGTCETQRLGSVQNRVRVCMSTCSRRCLGTLGPGATAGEERLVCPLKGPWISESALTFPCPRAPDQCADGTPAKLGKVWAIGRGRVGQSVSHATQTPCGLTGLSLWVDRPLACLLALWHTSLSVSAHSIKHRARATEPRDTVWICENINFQRKCTSCVTIGSESEDSWKPIFPAFWGTMSVSARLGFMVWLLGVDGSGVHCFGVN